MPPTASTTAATTGTVVVAVSGRQLAAFLESGGRRGLNIVFSGTRVPARRATRASRMRSPPRRLVTIDQTCRNLLVCAHERRQSVLFKGGQSAANVSAGLVNPPCAWAWTVS